MSVTQSVMGEKQFNWLTAEDILKAAEDSEQKITHSPIVLIPYDKEDEAETSLSIASNIPKDFFYNNFAILDSLSNQLIDRNEISSRPESNFNDIERVGRSSCKMNFKHEQMIEYYSSILILISNKRKTLKHHDKLS